MQPLKGQKEKEREREGGEREREEKSVNEGSEKELQHGVNKLIIFVAKKGSSCKMDFYFFFTIPFKCVVCNIYRNQKFFGNRALSLWSCKMGLLWYLWLKILLFKRFSFFFLVYNKQSCKIEFNYGFNMCC